MRTKRDVSGYRRVCFRPELTECPRCGARLRRSHNAWRKGIQTLRGNVLATSVAYACANPGCPKPAVYRSAEAEALSVKHRTYGADVVVGVGHQRHYEHRGVPEIAGDLRNRGLEISEREVYELSRVFEELLACRAAALTPDFYDAVEANGGIVLAVDGVQPETGNSTLYVLQDVLTRQVLHAEYLDNSSSAHVAALLEHVKALGLPILAVVSDHPHSIRLAVGAALPGVPHQFCHFHVLRNACQPALDLDRNLKKETRKAVRGLNPLETRLANRDDPDAGRVLTACLLLRSLLVAPSTVAFNWGGLEVFERLQRLDALVQRLLARRPDPDLERLGRLTARWARVQDAYDRVRGLAAYADEASRILALPARGGAAAVEARLRAFVGRLRDDAASGVEPEALEHAAKILESHWPGLFHCHRDPRRVPRTNNQLEVTIRRVKTGYRRATGRRAWDAFVAAHGRSVFLLPPDASRDDLLERAEAADRDEFAERWRAFEARRGRLRVLHVASKDFDAALDGLEAEWARA